MEALTAEPRHVLVHSAAGAVPAHARYDAWPGLVNPKMAEPIPFTRARWNTRRGASGWGRRLAALRYRSLRALRTWIWFLEREVTGVRRRTLAEVALGVPVALLAIEPLRKRVEAIPGNYGWLVIGVLPFLVFVLGLATRRATAREVENGILKTGANQDLITQIHRRHSWEAANGVAPTGASLSSSMGAVLKALAEISQQLLQIPDAVTVNANLMVPMAVRVEGDPAPYHGCGIVCYSGDHRSEPSWTRIAWGDMGPAEAFSSGRVFVTEDSFDPAWHDVFYSVRAHSIVSLPVTSADRRVIAVVNIVADRPLVFNRRDAGRVLYPVLASSLSLVADLLSLTRTVPPAGSES